MSQDYTDQLIDDLKRHEGKKMKKGRHVVYKCPAGYSTLGYGRNVERGITEAEAVYLLNNDIKWTVRELQESFPFFNGLSTVRKEVIINMCFNIGLPRLKKFKKMLAALEDVRFGVAAVEMLDSKWARQVGPRAKELSRRMLEG